MATGTAADIRQNIIEIKEVLIRLEGRLNVHDQKHVQIEKEQGEHAESIRQHSSRLAMVESLSAKNELDIEKLTSTLSRLVWIVVTPLVSTLVIALIILAAQVTK